MRLPFNRLFRVALLVILLLPGCQNKREVERKEYKALRAQLFRISRTPTEKLGEELDRLEDIEITTERIHACRDACLDAYRAIHGASLKSKEAQSVIETLEEESEVDPEVVEKRQEKALKLLVDSESELERANKLKDQCHDLLDDLESEGLERHR